MEDTTRNLWQAYKEKNDEKAREELILKYLPLVKYQVGRIKMTVPDFIEEDDLESYGILGLIDAINKFDYQHGVRFKTYATKRIRGEILDHLRNLDWLPHSLRRDAKRLQEMKTNLTHKLGHKPSQKELSQALNISNKKIEEINQKVYSSNWVSLYRDLGEDLQLLDVLVGKDEEPDYRLQRELKEEILAKALGKLNKSEKMVIALYYYEELTQKEIAEIMDLSPARVSQIHKKAVYRLRGFLSRKKSELIGKEA